MRTVSAPFLPDALLDAAEAVIHTHGIGALTLDAVAAQAKVSKGGLLHHFPSKDALIQAMVVRTAQRWKDDTVAAIAAVAPGPGRVCRGMLQGCIAKPDAWNESVRRSSRVFVTALASNPELVHPVRDLYADLRASLTRDRLAPGYGEVITLALDGVWFRWMFGLEEYSPAGLARLRRTLAELVKIGARRAGRKTTGPAVPRARGKPPPPRRKRPAPKK